MRPVLTKHNHHLFTQTLAQQNEDIPDQRLGTRAPDFKLGTMDITESPWHETAEEIEEGIANGKEKARLLKQVTDAMDEILPADERVIMALRFEHGLSYRAIGRIVNRNASTILRRVRRIIKKLQVQLGQGTV
jgi:RNA polymerase sigma factor (sigma-70 family)